MSHKKLQALTLTAVFAALLCVLSPLSIPFGIVPLSLASFAVYLAGCTLGWKKGSVAVLLYLAIGAVGLPVFSSFSGGIARLVGPTGGYLVGYLFCAFVCGWLCDRFPDKIVIYPIAMIAGTVLLYALGTAWFMIATGNGIAAALSACVLPFLPGDMAKIAVVTLVAPQLRKLIARWEKPVI